MSDDDSNSESIEEIKEEEKVKNEEENFRPHQQESVFWLEDILQDEPYMLEQTNKSEGTKTCRLEPTKDTEDL